MFRYLIVIIMLSGCSVSGENFNYIKAQCANNGGVLEYYVPFALDNDLIGDITCNDGIIIKSHNKNSIKTRFVRRTLPEEGKLIIMPDKKKIRLKDD